MPGEATEVVFGICGPDDARDVFMLVEVKLPHDIGALALLALRGALGWRPAVCIILGVEVDDGTPEVVSAAMLSALFLLLRLYEADSGTCAPPGSHRVLEAVVGSLFLLVLARI